MPVPDETPSRKLVIRRGLMRFIVDEAKYDTVQIRDDDGREGTYKSLGYIIVSAIEDGQEVPYVRREHVAAVPGRQDVAAGQVAILTAADQDIPPALARAAGMDDPAPAASDPAKAEDDETASDPSKTARKAPNRS